MPSKTTQVPTTKRRLTLRDNISGITKNAILKLLRRAGVKRSSMSLYMEIRGVLLRKLNTIMKNTLTFTSYDRRVTVMTQDVYAAAEQLGKTLVVGINKKAQKTKSLQRHTEGQRKEPKTRRAKPGTVALQQIRKQQRESDSLIFPAQNFKRLVAEVSQDLGIISNFRFAKDVISLIQLWVEDYIVELAADANRVAVHAGRETLQEKDISLVLTLRKELSC